MSGEEQSGGIDNPNQQVELGIGGFRGAVEVGRGGFGAVYRAYQPKFNRTVAIKVLSGVGADAKTRERFERERTAMGALSAQPNIMTVYDAGFTEFGHPYIVMEYTPAGSLAEVMAARGAFSADETVSIGVRMAEALSSAHQVGILHRDVKPENIMVSPFGEPLLSDFGIARMMSGPATRTGSVTASLDHAAPEVLEGKKPSEASDLYSLASSLYALAVGTAPFRKETDESLAPMLTRIMTTEVPSLDESVLPAAVFAELKRAMSKDPAERHGSAAQFADAMRSAAQVAALVLGPVRLDTEGTVAAGPVAVGDEDAIDPSKTYVYARIPRVEDSSTAASKTPAPVEAEEAAVLATPTAFPEPVEVGKENDDRRKLLVFGLAAVLVLLLGAAGFAAMNNGGDGETGPVAEGDWVDRQEGLLLAAAAGSTTTTVATPEEVSFEVQAGEPLNIPVQAGTTTDIALKPQHGTATVESDGSITYTSNASFSGEDGFSYESCQPDGTCVSIEVVIAVEGENPAPTVEDDSTATTAPDSVTIAVLDNDSDDDGLDAESLTIVTEPLNGTAEVNPDSTITYTPGAAFGGTDTFEYEVCDQAENPVCGSGTVTVDVTSDPSITVGRDGGTATTKPKTTTKPTPATTAPTTTTTTEPTTTLPANQAPTKLCSNRSWTLAGYASRYWVGIDNGCFTDPDGDSFTLRASQPQAGSIQSYTSGSGCTYDNCWDYLPKSGWDGTPYQDTFTFYARDEHGADSARVTVTLCVNC